MALPALELHSMPDAGRVVVAHPLDRVLAAEAAQARGLAFVLNVMVPAGGGVWLVDCDRIFESLAPPGGWAR